MPRWWVADAQATARQAVEDNTAYYLRGESSAGVDTSHYDGLAGREATAALLPQYAVRLDQL